MEVIILWLHIAGGTVALISGFLNIMRRKGDKRHVTAGNMFFYAMMLAGSTALVLSLIRPNYFLFVVGIFTLYMVGTGKRYIFLHNHRATRSVGFVDWLLSVIMLLAGILFIYLGVSSMMRSNMFGLVFVTFGSFGLFFVREDAKNYLGRSASTNSWLVGHLQRMTGGFIATLTAFLVVNADHFPGLIPGFVYWLLPTAILTPLIIKWSREFGVRRS